MYISGQLKYIFVMISHFLKRFGFTGTLIIKILIVKSHFTKFEYFTTE
jgi:hypothetical protein